MRDGEGTLLTDMSDIPPPASQDRPAAPALDVAVLRRLLALAGADAAALLRQLAADLCTDRDRLLAAARGPDLAGLRRGAHGIMALAGTVGDRGLSDLARSLHAAASGEAPPDTAPALALRVASGVAALVGALAAEGKRLEREGAAR